MNIYFHYSLGIKNRHLKECNVIMELIQQLGHGVSTPHTLKKKYKSFSRKNKKEIYNDIQKKKELIKLCNATIVESTSPSISAGFLVAYALRQHKNVLILYQEAPHAVFIGETNRLLTLKKYNTRDEKDKKKLSQDIQLFLENTQKKILKYRFNMMIDQSLNDFLKKEATRLHISRADYVRQLLFEKSTQER